MSQLITEIWPPCSRSFPNTSRVYDNKLQMRVADMAVVSVFDAVKILSIERLTEGLHLISLLKNTSDTVFLCSLSRLLIGRLMPTFTSKCMSKISANCKFSFEAPIVSILPFVSIVFNIKNVDFYCVNKNRWPLVACIWFFDKDFLSLESNVQNNDVIHSKLLLQFSELLQNCDAKYNFKSNFGVVGSVMCNSKVILSDLAADAGIDNKSSKEVIV